MAASMSVMWMPAIGTLKGDRDHSGL